MVVRLTADALAQFFELPRSMQPRVNDVVLRLAKWPSVSGVKGLRGTLTGNFRIRTGDYRILFRVEAEEIVVWKIANRRDVYSD
jgi:mRNA interferase RelE/StbE